MPNKKNLQEHQSISRLIGEECLQEKRWKKLEKERKRRRKKSDYFWF
jgi:hypothetical protein